MAQTSVVSEGQMLSGGEIGGRQRSLWSMGFRRLLRNRLAVVGLVVIGIMVFLWLAGPWIIPYDPYTDQNYDAVNELPSREHWFGTDALGRDNFSRVVTGIG